MASDLGPGLQINHVEVGHQLHMIEWFEVKLPLRPPFASRRTLALLQADRGRGVRHVRDLQLFQTQLLFNGHQLGFRLGDLLSQFLTAGNQAGLIGGRCLGNLCRQVLLLMTQLIPRSDQLATSVGQTDQLGQIDRHTPVPTVFLNSGTVLTNKLKVKHRGNFGRHSRNAGHPWPRKNTHLRTRRPFSPVQIPS